jgi:LysR family transcriptional regulator, nitrogen assimilation regulatory protein
MAGTLRDMRLFVAAYEERSFTAAARREHATQSGVSQHIRNLEDALGVSLFAREKGHVLPTPAGESYYARAVEVLRAHEAATSAARLHAGGLEGKIVVGLMPTLTRLALAPTLARFVQHHPNLVVSIVEGYSASLTAQALAGELDFAIVPAFSGSPGLRSRLFVRTQEVLVSSPGAPYLHARPVRLRDLDRLKLVVPSPANTRRHLIETYVGSNGVKVERMIELDAMLGTLDFVARTEWSAVLPAVMLEPEETRYTVAPIVDPTFTLDLVQIEPSRRTLSSAAEAFRTVLAQETSRLAAPWAALTLMDAV